MTDLTIFSAEELEQIQLAPVLVVTAASFSEPGGRYALVKEMVSGMKGLALSLQSHRSDLVVNILENIDEDALGDVESQDMDMTGPDSDAKRQELIDKSIAVAGEAIATIDRKAEPADVDAYAHALLNGAQSAVDATKTGSFLRFGGKRVTEAEAAYVKRLEAALGYRKVD